MKRSISPIIVVLIMILVCSQVVANQKDAEYFPNAHNEGAMQNIETTIVDNDKSNSEGNEPPQYSASFFSSVEELYEGLFIEYTVEQINNSRLRDLIEGRQNERSIYIPVYQGDRVAFRNKEGLSNVYIAPSDWMEQPWIFFNCRLETEELLIQTMYLEDEIIQDANDKGCSWLINQLSPNTPNVGNIDMFPHYKKIYEQNFELKDRSVNALVYELVEESKKDVSFVYDGILVCVSGEASKINDEWFKQLSFERFTMEPDTFMMTLSAGDGGNITIGTSGLYEQGDVINISATPNSGYKFSSWTATAGIFANANSADTTFTMPESNVTIIANFELVSSASIPIFTDGKGNEIDSLSSETLNVAMPYTNTADKPVALTMIVAVYSPDGRLRHTGMTTREVGASKTGTFNVSLYMPQNADGSYALTGYTAAVFLWDSKTFLPVMNKYIFPPYKDK